VEVPAQRPGFRREATEGPLRTHPSTHPSGLDGQRGPDLRRRPCSFGASSEAATRRVELSTLRCMQIGQDLTTRIDFDAYYTAAVDI
jgi:hypothetical protein